MKARPKVGDKLCYDMAVRERMGGGTQRHMVVTAVDEVPGGRPHEGIATFKDINTGVEDCFIYLFPGGDYNILFMEEEDV